MKIIKRVKMKKIKETVREELENFKTEKNKKRRIEIWIWNNKKQILENTR